ncbi:hypothetical protein ACFOWX_07590 [Sphingorhabdus arenilitoris]|uniref:Uncharacterized protein n=1 Tax=Sphingorhabdus arenilitoris TaxID=1490041 RepID=A0ABV8RHW8_9SPHN
MDNVLKMVVAILGIAGILAFIVPSSVPDRNAAPVEQTANQPQAAPAEQPPEPELLTDFESNPDDFAAPSIDGLPLDDFSQSSDDSSNQNSSPDAPDAQAPVASGSTSQPFQPAQAASPSSSSRGASSDGGAPYVGREQFARPDPASRAAR